MHWSLCFVKNSEDLKVLSCLTLMNGILGQCLIQPYHTEGGSLKDPKSGEATAYSCCGRMDEECMHLFCGPSALETQIYTRNFTSLPIDSHLLLSDSSKRSKTLTWKSHLPLPHATYMYYTWLDSTTRCFCCSNCRDLHTTCCCAGIPGWYL